MWQRLKNVYNRLRIMVIENRLEKNIILRVKKLHCSVGEHFRILHYLEKMKAKGAIFDYENDCIKMDLNGTYLCAPLLDMSFLDIVEEYEKDEYELKSWNLKDKVILDVGANIGDSALKFFSHGAKKVISLEPNKSLEKYYMLNMSNNAIAQYQHFDFGLSDQSEILSVSHRPWASAGTTSIDKLSSKHSNSWPELKLKLVAIRDFIELELMVSSVDVVKLDCEGSEYGILMSGELFKLDPHLILLEYHLGTQDLAKVFHERGYDTRIKEKSQNVGLIFATKRT